MSETIIKKHHYSNLAVYSPSGKFMFFANKSRIKFYKKKELIKRIHDDKYQLLFEPKGLGWSDYSSSRYGLEPVSRKNICVATGVDFDLTRHHVMPQALRKITPERYSNNSLLVLLLNKDIHINYTKEETLAYRELCDIYGIDHTDFNGKVTPRLATIRSAVAILRHGTKMPKEKLNFFEDMFKTSSGLEPTVDNMRLFENQPPENIHVNGDGKTIFEVIMTAEPNPEIIENFWIKHFLHFTKPKFLPLDFKNECERRNISL